jgi:hypothetical protein
MVPVYLTTAGVSSPSRKRRYVGHCYKDGGINNTFRRNADSIAKMRHKAMSGQQTLCFTILSFEEEMNTL